MFYLTFLVSPPQKRGICIFIDNLRLLETENRKIYQELTVEYGTPFSYFWKCLLPSGNSADRLQESNSISCSWCNFLRLLNRGNYSNRVSSLCTITQIAYYLPFVCVWSVNGEKPGLSIPTLGTFFHEYKVRIRVQPSPSVTSYGSLGLLTSFLIVAPGVGEFYVISPSI